MPRVLVVEDERKVLRGLERGLRAEGYEVLAAADGEEGLRLALTQSPDCVVLDLMLPGRRPQGEGRLGPLPLEGGGGTPEALFRPRRPLDRLLRPCQGADL